MATDPPGRLMRKHGDEQRPVYYGSMDNPKDAEYESDSESSESSASIAVASAEEDELREKELAAAAVRSPSFPT